jgi:hypothetical protein
LSDFKSKPNRNCQPKYVFKRGGSNETYPKAERYREQNIFIDIPNAENKKATITKI